MTTPGNEQLEGLLERVKAATGPDEKLDYAIDEWLWRSGGKHHGEMDTLPPFTASIDAALALVERLRGDHWFGILLDAMRDFGAAGTLGPEHLPRFIVLHLLTALKEASE